MGPCIPVILAQAGIQGPPHKSRLPLWTPDHVRGDDVSHKRALTLRSVASRRGSPLQAPDLQPLLRDGAIAPPQDENGTLHPRHTRAGWYPGLQAPIVRAALDPGSGPG